RRSWSWQQYLNEQKAEAAPVSLFTQSQSFPSRKTGFKVGMKLEGIDPLHPSMFCVLTVAEVTHTHTHTHTHPEGASQLWFCQVIGCRLRLHIDGFSECYDFWVNSDSAEIRPAGWCKDNKRKLHPPKGQNQSDFDWTAYLDSCGSRAAPSSLFTSHRASCDFQVGMKLEAVDKKNPGLVCVASVTDVVDGRFLVHFDNWDDTYDYWCDSSSPYIHPVGWCEEQGRPLTSPQGAYTRVCTCGTWNLVPSALLFFRSSKPGELPVGGVSTGNWFGGGSQLSLPTETPPPLPGPPQTGGRRQEEPMLIRVATVTETDDCRVKVLPVFGRWWWADVVSRFTTTAGPSSLTSGVTGTTATFTPSAGVNAQNTRWSRRQVPPRCPPPPRVCVPPLAAEASATSKEPATPDTTGQSRRGWCDWCYWCYRLLPGCHLSTALTQSFGCPYSDINTRKEVVLPDRLGGERVITLVPVSVCSHGNQPDRYLSSGLGSEPDWRRLGGGFGVETRSCSRRVVDPAGVVLHPHLPVSRRDRTGVQVKSEDRREPLVLSVGKRKAADSPSPSQPSKFLRVKEEEEELQVTAVSPAPTESSLQAALHQSIFLSAMSAQPGRDLSLCWEQHRKLLPGVVRETAETVQHWSVQQVADFVESLPGCEEQSKQFRDEQIDGRAFLLLTQRDIVRIMSIKLGPALKIYNSILMFKHAKSRSQ
ncbi:unnamed protein product, partial [Tetraodon nigroviridis]